jgi:hypothetical protein
MLRTTSDLGRGGRFAVGSVLLTATLAVAVTGCSSTGSGQAAPAAPPSVTDSSTSSAAPTTSSAPAAAASTSASVPVAATTSTSFPSAPLSKNTGSYLSTLLPNTKWSLGPSLPAGWVADGAADKDSGPTATAPAPSIVSDGTCDYLTGKNDMLDLAGGLSVASASGWLGNGSAGVALAFYAYNPGDAAKSLAQVRDNVTTTCDGYTAMMLAGHLDVKVSATPVSGLGDEALLIKTLPQGPYVSEENLLVRRGNLVMSLSSNDIYGDLPDLTPAAAALATGMQ